MILTAGADVNNTDDNGSTALMIAEDHDYSDIVEMLIESGAGAY